MKVDSSNSLYTIIRLSMLSVLWWYYGLDRFVMLSLCHLLNLKNVSENVIFNYDRETSFIFAVNYSTFIMLCNVNICSEWYDNLNLIISSNIGNFSNRKPLLYSCIVSYITVLNINIFLLEILIIYQSLSRRNAFNYLISRYETNYFYFLFLTLV